MQTNSSLLEYYKNVSSDAPAPGGGSVSAYLITLNIGLYLMAIKVSIKRKRFLKLENSIQKNILKNIENLDLLNLKILEYVDQDVDTFNNFMDAYRSKNEDRIKEESIKCFYDPYNVLNIMFEAIDIMLMDYKYIVETIVSDLKISFINLVALLDVTKENMNVNLKNISDAHINELANEAYKKLEIYKEKLQNVIKEL